MSSRRFRKLLISVCQHDLREQMEHSNVILRASNINKEYPVDLTKSDKTRKTRSRATSLVDPYPEIILMTNVNVSIYLRLFVLSAHLCHKTCAISIRLI